MSFSRNGYIANARKLGPSLGIRIVLPCVVIVILAVGPAEDVNIVTKGDDGVTSSLWW